jgi:hypothetical protein
LVDGKLVAPNDLELAVAAWRSNEAHQFLDAWRTEIKTREAAQREVEAHTQELNQERAKYEHLEKALEMAREVNKKLQAQLAKAGVSLVAEGGELSTVHAQGGELSKVDHGLALDSNTRPIPNCPKCASPLVEAPRAYAMRNGDTMYWCPGCDDDVVIVPTDRGNRPWWKLWSARRR